jgi:hypothetical protein
MKRFFQNFSRNVLASQNIFKENRPIFLSEIIATDPPRPESGKKVATLENTVRIGDTGPLKVGNFVEVRDPDAPDTEALEITRKSGGKYVLKDGSEVWKDESLRFGPGVYNERTGKVDLEKKGKPILLREKGGKTYTIDGEQYDPMEFTPSEHEISEDEVFSLEEAKAKIDSIGADAKTKLEKQLKETTNIKKEDLEKMIAEGNEKIDAIILKAKAEIDGKESILDGKIFKNVAKEIEDAFGKEAEDQLKLSEKELKAKQVIKQGKDSLFKWLKTPENRLYMRKLVFTGWDGKGIPKGSLKTNFSNVETTLNLDSKGKKTVWRYLRIGNLFETDQLKHINGVQKGSGKKLEPAYFTEGGLNHREGVYTKKLKYCAILQGTRIFFSDKPVLEEMKKEEGDHQKEYKKLEAKESASKLGAKAKASKDVAEELKEPAEGEEAAAEAAKLAEKKGKAPLIDSTAKPTSAPEPKTAEEEVEFNGVKYSKTETKGEYAIKDTDGGTATIVDKSQLDVVIGAEIPKQLFLKAQIAKAFPFMNMDTLKGDVIFKFSGNSQCTATFQSKDKPGYIIASFELKTGKKKLTLPGKQDLSHLVKPGGANLAQLMRTKGGENANETAFKVEKETAQSYVLQKKWGKALEAMLKEGGKYDVDLAALCIENYIGTWGSILDKDGGKEKSIFAQDLHKYIAKFSTTNIYKKTSYDKLKKIAGGEKLDTKSLNALIKRLDKNEKELKTPYLKALLKDTEYKNIKVIGWVIKPGFKIALDESSGNEALLKLGTKEEVDGMLVLYQSKVSADKIIESKKKVISYITVPLDNIDDDEEKKERVLKFKNYIEFAIMKNPGSHDSLYALLKPETGPHKDPEVWAAVQKKDDIFNPDLLNALPGGEKEKLPYLSAYVKDYVKLSSLDNSKTITKVGKTTHTGKDDKGKSLTKENLAVGPVIASILETSGEEKDRLVALKMRLLIEQKNKEKDPTSVNARMKTLYDNLPKDPEVRVEALEMLLSYVKSLTVKPSFTEVSGTQFEIDLEGKLAEAKYEKGDLTTEVKEALKEDSPKRKFLEIYLRVSGAKKEESISRSELAELIKNKASIGEENLAKLSNLVKLTKRSKIDLKMHLGLMGEAAEMVEELDEGFIKEYFEIRLDPSKEYENLKEIATSADLGDASINDVEIALKVRALERLYELSKTKGEEERTRIEILLADNAFLQATKKDDGLDKLPAGREEEVKNAILDARFLLVKCEGVKETKVGSIDEYAQYFSLKIGVKEDDTEKLTAEDVKELKDYCETLKGSATGKSDIESAGKTYEYAYLALTLYYRTKDKNHLKIDGEWIPEAWFKNFDGSDHYLLGEYFLAKEDFENAVKYSDDDEVILVAAEKAIRAKSTPETLHTDLVDLADKYKAAGKINAAAETYIKAFDEAIENSKQDEITERVWRFLKDNAGDIDATYTLQIAERFEKIGSFDKAAKALYNFNRPDLLIKFYERHLNNEAVNIDFSLFPIGLKDEEKVIIGLLSKERKCKVVGNQSSKQLFYSGNHKAIKAISNDEEKKRVKDALGGAELVEIKEYTYSVAENMKSFTVIDTDTKEEEKFILDLPSGLDSAKVQHQELLDGGKRQYVLIGGYIKLHYTGKGKLVDVFAEQYSGLEEKIEVEITGNTVRVKSKTEPDHIASSDGKSVTVKFKEGEPKEYTVGLPKGFTMKERLTTAGESDIRVFNTEGEIFGYFEWHQSESFSSNPSHQIMLKGSVVMVNPEAPKEAPEAPKDSTYEVNGNSITVATPGGGEGNWEVKKMPSDFSLKSDSFNHDERSLNCVNILKGDERIALIYLKEGNVEIRFYTNKKEIYEKYIFNTADPKNITIELKPKEVETLEGVDGLVEDLEV